MSELADHVLARLSTPDVVECRIGTMVGGDGAEPVDPHGAAVGEQVLELAAGPLDA